MLVLRLSLHINPNERETPVALDEGYLSQKKISLPNRIKKKTILSRIRVIDSEMMRSPHIIYRKHNLVLCTSFLSLFLSFFLL